MYLLHDKKQKKNFQQQYSQQYSLKVILDPLTIFNIAYIYT